MSPLLLLFCFVCFRCLALPPFLPIDRCRGSYIMISTSILLSSLIDRIRAKTHEYHMLSKLAIQPRVATGSCR
uniref:Putative secreted peptide n=1 Tax=Anopheles braziliensis TaxID=58242 RepID=A0A2M3ZNN9_9DIPT